jgi:hypothetical protein
VPDVESRLKDNKGFCNCGCRRYGTFRVKPWRNGVLCVRACDSCRNCKGRIAKKGGQRDQQRVGAKRLSGGSAGRRDEQSDRWTFRWENKRDNRYAKPVFECYSKSFALALATGPLVVEATGKLRPYSLFVFRDDQIREFCDGTYELHSGIHMPVHTSFNAMERIDEQMRPIGDWRPFIFRAAQPRMKFGLVVCRGDQLSEVRIALRLQHGFADEDL